MAHGPERRLAMHGFGFGWMGLYSLIFLGGLVALLFWIVPRWRPGGSQEDRARAILRERFARGEIDQDEFERRMRRLGGE
jgi:putative membrane protein